MKKRIRQYIGLLSAVLAYYAGHEGAHLLYGNRYADWNIGGTNE